MPKGARNPAALFPNRKSPFRTPASLLFDVHYAKLGILCRWDWARYNRLCSFLQFTPAEMASLVMLRHSHLAGAKRDNVFSGPVALLLTLIEAQAMSAYTKDVIAEPLPKLS